MGKDPYRYFRIEAREHVEGLSAGVLELEKRPNDRHLIDRLLRYAHTLKGAARVVRQPAIADLSHSIEEILSPFRDDATTPDRATINRLLQLVDSITGQVNSLPGSSHYSPVHPEVREFAQAANNFQTLRIEIGELDPLMHAISEIGINVGALRRQAMALDDLLEMADDRAAASTGLTGDLASTPAMTEAVRSSLQQFRRSLLTQIERTEREVLQLQDRAGQIRLVPASSVFPSLERACRDAADTLRKRVEFHAGGGDSRLESHVLNALSGALQHLVRNAVSHGIEPPEEREAANKPVVGRVEIAIERRGNRVTFVCSDDGRGVDVGQVRRTAVARGQLSSVEADVLSPQQAIRLLLGGGISTADAVTQLSGRGVGLDVVRETLQRLGGAVEMQSTPEAGTMVRVTVPVSLESIVVLDVEVAGQRVSIPLDAIRRVIRVSDVDVAHAPGGDSILFDGMAVPLVPLQRLLFPSVRTLPALRRAIIVESGQHSVALGVDRMLGKGTVILKPLPAAVAGAELLIGASLNASGDPQPVLDPERLVNAARRAAGTPVPAVPATKPCVLVVDDSLTTRMLEQSILEAAGYEVDLAVSGEDAMEKAASRAYAIFVVDVEMPGMSGFEFVARTRSDPGLQRIPAILVTSRDAPEDRVRGQAAGAAAYIVKGEFDQTTFLGIIRRLTG